MSMSCAEISAPGLDGFRHRDAFDHVPGQPRLLDDRLALLHFVIGPGLAAVHVMQRRDDAAGARLTHMGERHGIVRAKPAPGLFHGCSLPNCSSVRRCAKPDQPVEGLGDGGDEPRVGG